MVVSPSSSNGSGIPLGFFVSEHLPRSSPQRSFSLALSLSHGRVSLALIASLSLAGSRAGLFFLFSGSSFVRSFVRLLLRGASFLERSPHHHHHGSNGKNHGSVRARERTSARSRTLLYKSAVDRMDVYFFLVPSSSSSSTIYMLRNFAGLFGLKAACEREPFGPGENFIFFRNHRQRHLCYSHE